MVIRGRNYFDLNEYERRTYSASSKKRVFISHKKEDTDFARKVADYVMDAGIDVYFDEKDSSIDRTNPESVVKAIKRGMKLSSHMIVIFTNKTLNSHWVPWEIGYGDATSTDIRVLKMNDIKKENLPEYLQIAKVIFDIDGLNNYLAEIRKSTKNYMIAEGSIKNYDSTINKLKGIIEPYVRTLK